MCWHRLSLCRGRAAMVDQLVVASGYGFGGHMKQGGGSLRRLSRTWVR